MDNQVSLNSHQVRQEIKEYLKNNLRIEVDDVDEVKWDPLFGKNLIIARKVFIKLDGEVISSATIEEFDHDQG